MPAVLADGIDLTVAGELGHGDEVIVLGHIAAETPACAHIYLAGTGAEHLVDTVAYQRIGRV